MRFPAKQFHEVMALSYIPRQYPGSPRRQSTGLINRIVNFFKNMLGMGTPAYGPDGEPTDASNPGESGILSFIRRTFGGLINRFMSILGNGSQGPSVNPDAAEFPYQRPSRQEPLRSRNWILRRFFYKLFVFFCLIIIKFNKLNDILFKITVYYNSDDLKFLIKLFYN